MTDIKRRSNGQFAPGKRGSAGPAAVPAAPVPAGLATAEAEHRPVFINLFDPAQIPYTSEGLEHGCFQLRPLTEAEKERGDQVARTAMGQIGRMNVLAISGGRVVVVSDKTFRLPVSHGYNVEVTLEADDTYTVRRIFERGGVAKSKGELRNVYFDNLGEVAYKAHAFHNGDFPALMFQD